MNKSNYTEGSKEMHGGPQITKKRKDLNRDYSATPRFCTLCHSSVPFLISSSRSCDRSMKCDSFSRDPLDSSITMKSLENEMQYCRVRGHFNIQGLVFSNLVCVKIRVLSLAFRVCELPDALMKYKKFNTQSSQRNFSRTNNLFI
jgi:hypothetical protein